MLNIFGVWGNGRKCKEMIAPGLSTCLMHPTWAGWRGGGRGDWDGEYMYIYG